MKIKPFLLLAAAFLLLASFSHSVLAQSSTGTPTTPPATTRGTGAHPAIRAAIVALERAKVELTRAKHDFGGHRADALAECDKAIAQLRLALRYAPAPATGTAPAASP